MYEIRTRNGVKAQPFNFEKAGISGAYREYFFRKDSAKMYTDLLNKYHTFSFEVSEVKK